MRYEVREIDAMNDGESWYWNTSFRVGEFTYQVHGYTAEDVLKDREGLQTMRNLARNMSFMIKSFKDARVKYGYPEVEKSAFTSFPDGK